MDAVRYYERRRLLATAPRSGGGFRLFTEEAVERIRFIKQAQDNGFSLDEIKELLTSGGAAQCQRVHDLLKAKLVDLDARMETIRKFRRSLAHHLEMCETELNQRGATASCPVITQITHSKRKAKR